jgi:iron only hydrogenase large subunit-like protein/uncharacterized Fe-S cluster-containing protein
MNTITTSQARCRDCYKCIRHCPVKAIGLNDGQAWVDQEKCILCGQCIGACPQKAKSMPSQLPLFENFLAESDEVVISLAPSYLAAGPFLTPWKLLAGLKRLGKLRIEETALGAERIAAAYHRLTGGERPGTVISGCCPVVVNLIEKYFPKLVPSLAGVVSPLLAHSRMIKAEQGPSAKVVFIGPCLAKKAEPDWDSPENPVDAVLTFDEVAAWLETNGPNPDSLEDGYPDRSSAHAAVFPLQHGIIQTAGIKQGLNREILSVTGIDDCLETFRDLEQGLLRPGFVEALACKGGCIGGPAMGNSLGVNVRRDRLLRFAADRPAAPVRLPLPPPQELHKNHQPRPRSRPVPTEAEIREILSRTGKHRPEDETNCGGCGYPSCREKAVAVFQGMAEPEMCVPYMKEKAESFSNTIVDTALNAIVVVDQDLIIQEFNPMAERMFNRKNVPSKGKPLSAFIDPADFETVWTTQAALIDQVRSYDQYGLITRQIIYPLSQYGVIIGIFTDITEEENQKLRHDAMRREALDKASMVIREQMRVVQNIAGLLGESTAETKATLLELIAIMNESGAP